MRSRSDILTFQQPNIDLYGCYQTRLHNRENKSCSYFNPTNPIVKYPTNPKFSTRVASWVDLEYSLNPIHQIARSMFQGAPATQMIQYDESMSTDF